MRIDLPSGAWVEVRDKLTREDQQAVQGAVDIEMSSSEDGGNVVRMRGDHQMVRENALLARIITNWSFAEQGIPIPGNNLAGAEAIPAAISDLDDANDLSEKIAPLMDKVNPGRRPNSRKPSPAS